MAGETRDQFLNAAESLFAEFGFYGVSIANIAAELGLTKQALLHHFGTKEKLYGAVLDRVSRGIQDQSEQTIAREDPGGARFTASFVALFEMLIQTPSRGQLLMRELLDNKRRAEHVGAWYLKPLLDNLVAQARLVPGWETASDARALALVYQLIGAAHYFVISQPTLSGIYGAEAYAALRVEFIRHLTSLVSAALAAGPGD